MERRTKWFSIGLDKLKKVKTIHITQPLLRDDFTHVDDFRSARGRGELIALNQTKFSGNSHFYFRQLVEDM